jgi:hypothetical protein
MASAHICIDLAPHILQYIAEKGYIHLLKGRTLRSTLCDYYGSSHIDRRIEGSEPPVYVTTTVFRTGLIRNQFKARTLRSM